MTYYCKLCSYSIDSRKMIRKHAKTRHHLKGEDYKKGGEKTSAVSNSYERRTP